MKKIALILILCLFLLKPGFSAFAWRHVENKAFSVGEELEFDMGWKAATAGTALIKVVQKGARKNRSAYKIVCEASTNEAIDFVFKVRDRFESWMDTGALCSLGSARRINEGTTVMQEDIFIDPVSKKFQRRKLKPTKQSSASQESGSTPPYVQDVVSVLYYIRTQPLVVGKSISTTVMNGSDFYELAVQVLRKEKVTTDLGTFSCFVLEPILKNTDGSKQEQKEQINIWMTDDDRRLPIQIAAELPFGQVTATLVRFVKK